MGKVADPRGTRRAEAAALEEFDFAPSAYSSLGVPTVLIAGEHSRRRPPYGPSVEQFRDALQLENVTLLEGHDHLAHVTGPLDLARAINASIGAWTPRHARVKA